MANVVKRDGSQSQGQQPQAQQPQAQPPQGARVGPQRSELARRDQIQQMMREPFALLARDPFQLMRDMMIDPFRALSTWGMLGRGDVGWSPSFEVRETDDAFVFKADMPGVRAEDIDISLDGNQLVISGRREHEREQEEGRFYAYERAFGSFQRVFTLPDSADVDNIRSNLEDGVLTLVVPKKAEQAQRRRKIEIRSGSKS